MQSTVIDMVDNATSLLHRFVDSRGLEIRVRGTHDEPWFCLKDLCDALGITNHRHKGRLLRNDQKLGVSECTSGQSRQMTFVSEAGLYRIIFSCKTSNVLGTAAYSFVNWVTEQVLPSIRKNGIYELKQEIKSLKEERGRRLWNVVKLMDNWTFNVRRNYFNAICSATRDFCYLDEFDSPHVTTEHLTRVQLVISKTIAAKILASVPADHSKITDHFEFVSSELIMNSPNPAI